MKFLLRLALLCLLGWGNVYAQSNLPPCPSLGYFDNCFGNYISPNGVKYVGEWKENIFHGQGTEYASNGLIINQGVWANGFFVRPATVQQSSVANQTVAVAAVQPDISLTNLPACQGRDATRWGNCFGTFTFANGEKYVGEFKNGKRNGQGTFYASNGLVTSQGMWADGNFVRSVSLQQATATNTEIERLRAEAEEAKRKQAELEQQLRIAQQQTTQTPPVTIQTAITTGKRVALVVGNKNYKVRPLQNSLNDADDISRSLRTSGFEVIDLRDATLPQMRTAVRQFGDKLLAYDVGLVYYSGHGVEVKGRNYFIPVNADIQREDEIADQGLDVSLILEKMSTAGKGVNILIVDACRDDPFGRSFRSSSRGLANMDAPRGTIIAYATSPGKVASDGDPRERNSPYTKHLVKAMQSPNKPIEQVFKEVRRAVQDETKNQQTPWENTSLSGDFFFRVLR